MTYESSANSPCVDLKEVIEESSFGLTFGTDLFIAEAPEQPDEVVCLYDVPGGPQDRYGLEYPAMQVYVRSNSYTDGYNLIKDIKYTFHYKENFTINGTRYLLVSCISDIGILGRDDFGRYQFSVNFQIMRSGI